MRNGYRFSALELGIVESVPSSDEEQLDMIITNKALPTRTFVRGIQVSLALPLLDAYL